MRRLFSHWMTVIASALCLAAVAVPDDVQAARRAKTTGPKVIYAGGETEAQRQRSEEARLRRECQGRPNAGACLGYTSPPAPAPRARKTRKR